MADIKEDLKKDGYSQEEAYFYKMNQELLAKRRQELDATRATQADRSTMPWWMKCPKCGTQMQEIDMGGIKVDKCGGCSGVYFDNGELDTLMQAQEPKGFLGALKRRMR